MLRSLLAILFGLVLPGASFAQQNANSEAQAAPANPCGAPNTQMEMNQCSAEEYKKADAHLNAVYRNLLRLLEKDASNAQQQNSDEQKKAF